MVGGGVGSAAVSVSSGTGLLGPGGSVAVGVVVGGRVGIGLVVVVLGVRAGVGMSRSKYILSSSLLSSSSSLGSFSLSFWVSFSGVVVVVSSLLAGVVTVLRPSRTPRAAVAASASFFNFC